MDNKLSIRRTIEYTVNEASKVVELNPSAFKNISQPFEGETAEDFVNYLHNLEWDLVMEELDEETQRNLNELFEGDTEEFYNSAWDGSDTWIESGEQDEIYTKTGGFKVTDSSKEY